MAVQLSYNRELKDHANTSSAQVKSHRSVGRLKEIRREFSYDHAVHKLVCSSAKVKAIY